ncbi:MAG: hypothetical protein FJ215_08470 [Ignavibacteria bacterium]|nr:hypothetical protein [Ignavibacteria bacterium]
MGEMKFLGEFVILLAAAVLIVSASKRLRIPSVVGFLITGMLIGPSGFHFIGDKDVIEILADLGVVMLLFFIGIEFSLAQLRAIRRQFFLGGGAQVLATILIVIGIASLGSFTASEKVFFGFLVALSSTAILLKVLSDRGELDSPHGRLSIAVTLFQDLCIVPMIVLTPILAGGSEFSFLDLAGRFSLGVFAVAVIFFAARYVMPKILHQIARVQVREVFLMGALFFCLLMSYVTASFGFSYALGAFIAGLIISESEYSHEVVAEIVGFRDLFSSLFFISVGMLLDLTFVADQPLTILGISVGIFLIKAMIVVLVGLLLRSSPRTAIITAFSLAQVGEFSFVLAKVGQTHGLLDGDLYQYFLSASVFTMIVTPPLIAFAPRIAERTQHLIPMRKIKTEGVPANQPVLTNHVIIAGYGVNGQNLARVLRETGIPYVIVETKSDVVERLMREGHPVVFGDITRKDILQNIGIGEARLIVFAISDPQATRTGVHLARAQNANLYIIVRTRLVSEIDELSRLGADEVIPEEFETSIEIFTRVLTQYHIPRNVINAQIKVIRNENYGMLRGLPQSTKGLDRVAQLLAAGTSDTYLITDECFAIGKTLGELDFRGKTGTTIIAVVRGETPHISPARDFTIESGDTLVLVGTHASMDKAFEYLDCGFEPSK